MFIVTASPFLLSMALAWRGGGASPGRDRHFGFELGHEAPTAFSLQHRLQSLPSASQSLAGQR